jgi:hypothetical protein
MSMRLFKQPTIVAILLAAGAARAESERTVAATRIAEGEIVVDGKCDELTWTNATWYQDFVQRSPYENFPPSEQTRIAVVFDDEALYVFVHAHDATPERIRARLTRRDEWSPSDWVEVWLAPQQNRRNGYRFALNPRGVQIDSRLSDSGATQDLDWNALWRGATTVGDDGWNAEFRIPFRALRFENSDTPWGFNVVRYIARSTEESLYSATPKASARPLLHMADLGELEVASRSHAVELWPYLSLSASGQHEDYQLTPRMGGEINIGLGASRALQLTALPDFGQVEADPSQLNLTAFEVTFPEKRRFFLEGREFFRVPLAMGVASTETMFYTRRIGAQPTRELGVPESAIVEYPERSTILGAAKLTGRETSGLSYAFLSAVTDTEHAHVRAETTETHPRVAAPTAYTVGRLRKEFGSNSAWGGVFTHVRRDLDDDLSPHYVRQALGVASDFEMHQGRIGLLGNVAATHLTGSADAIAAVQRSSVHYTQRPDAHHLHYDAQRTSLTGWSAELTGGKLDGAPWRAHWRVYARSPEFNPNDLGYLRKADQQHAEVWLQRREDSPGRWHKYYHVGTMAWVDKTFGPEITSLGAKVEGYWELPDHSSTYAGLRRNQSALDVSLLRGGPAFRVPGKWDAWLGVGTDERRAADVDVEFWGHARDEASLLRAIVSVALNMRPSSALRLSLAPSFDRSQDDLQYVSTEPDNRVILGRLLRNTVSFTLRAGLAITNHLHFDAYAMPYFTAGTFQSFFQVTDPLAASYSDRIIPVAYDGDRRFAVAQLRSNLLLRWENLHGAIIYLVWSREQTHSDSELGVVRLDRDMGTLLSSSPIDVIMLKLVQGITL